MPTDPEVTEPGPEVVDAGPEESAEVAAETSPELVVEENVATEIVEASTPAKDDEGCAGAGELSSSLMIGLGLLIVRRARRRA